MSILDGIQAAARAFEEQTGRKLVSMTVSEDEWPWLLAEATNRCNVLDGGDKRIGELVIEIDGVYVAMQPRPLRFRGTTTL